MIRENGRIAPANRRQELNQRAIVIKKGGGWRSMPVKSSPIFHFFVGSVTVIVKGREGTETNVFGLSVALGSLLKGT